MTRRTKVSLGSAAAAVVVGAGALFGVAAATGGGVGPIGGDSEKPLTGQTKDKAVEAALASVNGEGTVTETEAGDDGAAYGVEIRLPDGSQVEVNLDTNFDVIGSSPDDDGPNDKDGSDNDAGSNGSE